MVVVFLAGCASLSAFIGRQGDDSLAPWGFVAIASGIGIAIAIVAMRVVDAVPLDVVLDVEGVTFSGVTRAWSALATVSDVGSRGESAPRHERSLSRPPFWRRRYVVYETSEGPLRIGPLGANDARILVEESLSRIQKRPTHTLAFSAA